MCKALLIDDQPMSRLAAKVLLEQEDIESAKPLPLPKYPRFPASASATTAA